MTDRAAFGESGVVRAGLAITIVGSLIALGRVCGASGILAARSVTPDAADRSTPRTRILTVRLGAPDAVDEPRPGADVRHGGHELISFPLWPVSDFHLEKLGLPAVSPAWLFIDGALLPRATSLTTARRGCSPCFYHKGSALLFFKEGSSLNSTAHLELTSAFPMIAPDGAPAYWVYPGTTVSWQRPDGWQGSVIQVMVEGFAFHPVVPRVGAGLFLGVGALRAPLLASGPDGRVTASLGVAGTTPADVRVISESGSGSFFLARRVRYLGDGGMVAMLDLPDPPPRQATDEVDVTVIP